MKTSISNSGALLVVFSALLGTSLLAGAPLQAQSPYGAGGTSNNGATSGQSGGAKFTWDANGAQVTVRESGPNCYTVTHDGTRLTYQVTMGGLNGRYSAGGGESGFGDGSIGNTVTSGRREFCFYASGYFYYYKEADAAIIWNGGGTGACTTEPEHVEGYYGTFISPVTGTQVVALFCSNGAYSLADLLSSGRQINTTVGFFTKY